MSSGETDDDDDEEVLFAYSRAQPSVSMGVSLYRGKAIWASKKHVIFSCCLHVQFCTCCHIIMNLSSKTGKCVQVGSTLHQIDVVSFEECLVDKPEYIDPEHLPRGLI